ncbi:FAD binding domain-containing protein [Pseudaminobacter sp. 19-2017]|uniref:FAD binding domain-containing protein n=1 Tax=Pseudaminobacter soli (ex Zhang et al. 2022) TaxID=2831468 RepID=A0A942DZY5_9HYPH|nr:FAD binding domain-containing protein [Pseudaminobacter soli]
MTRYAKPEKVEDALALLAEGEWRVLSGGTDFYPAQGSRPIRDNVLDIAGLSDLRGITETSDHWVLGARTTWTEVLGADLPPSFNALKQAGRDVGSVQIQNVATVAGNLCNASPAADGVPALMVLSAEVELRSLAGARHVPLHEFILGNRRTALSKDELVTAIRVPKAASAGQSAFVKLGARRYLVISIAMAAARIETASDGTIAMAAITVGACSPVARRLGGLEGAIVGLHRGANLRGALRDAPMPELSPIDDVRGTAEYRLEAAREIATRAVMAAVADFPQEGEWAA